MSSFLFIVNKTDDDGKSVTNLPAVGWSHFFLPNVYAICDLYMTKTKTMRNAIIYINFVLASVNAILCESSKGMNIMELKRIETCVLISYQH